MTTPAIPFDRNLLFGVLALQMDFIDRNQLIAAMGNWFTNRERPLSDVLVQQGVLDGDVLELIDKLVSKHLDRHHGQPDHGLTDLPAATIVRKALSHLSDSISEETHTFTPQTKPEAPESSTIRSEIWANDRYVVLRSHAKGGLGQVSVALDKQLDREVAFKELLSYHADQPDTRARFELEARVTGALEHPGIVPIYSMGHNGRGQPYYAMRFIRGQNLREAIMRMHGGEGTHALQVDSLEFRRLLGCFLDVCHAIHYAHSRGVLHRDIKPHNILIGDYGETLVVDWGLAKPRGASANDDMPTVVHNPLRIESGEVTHLGSVVGTPNYMSPEQAHGDLQNLGPAADVFSLGATLYCLLTNQSPYRGPDPSVVLRKAQVCDRPDVLAINPGVSKPLAAICRKAMAREASDRYATAQELAKEVERWLADEPVAAYRDSSWERSRRWARKHRGAVRVAFVSLVLLAIGGTTAAFVIDQARRDVAASRLEALERLKQARKSVDTWLATTGEALNWDVQSLEFQLIEPRVQDARRKLLESAASEYERLAQDETDDVDLEIERSRAYQRLAKVRSLAGESEKSADEVRKAIQVLTAVAAKSPANSECTHELGNSFTQLGAALASAKHIPEAVEAYEQALSTFGQLKDADAQTVEARDSKAVATYNLARARLEMRRFDDAAKLLAQSLATYDELSQAAEDGAKFGKKSAQLRGGVAEVNIGLGRLDAAAEQFQLANRQMDALVSKYPERADILEQRAVLRIVSTTAWSRLGRLREELAANLQAKADFERLRRLRPDRMTEWENYAISLLRVGEMQHRHEEFAAAQVSLEAAEKEYAELVARFPAVLRFREGQAHCREALGVTLLSLGKFADAERNVRLAVEALAGLRNTAPEWPAFSERLAVALAHHGQTLSALGNDADAGRQFSQAIEWFGALINSDSEDRPYKSAAAFASYRYGITLLQNGQETAAATRLSDAEQIWRQLASGEVASASDHYNLARFYLLCPDESRRNAKRALEHAQLAIHASPENPAFHGILAAAWYRNGDWKKCLAALDASDRHRQFANDWNDLFRGMAEVRLGQSVAGTDHIAAGKRYFAEHRPGDSDLRRLVAEAEKLVSAAKPAPPRASEP
jgi:serine/threonine protein kinase